MASINLYYKTWVGTSFRPPLPIPTHQFFPYVILSPRRMFLVFPLLSNANTFSGFFSLHCARAPQRTHKLYLVLCPSCEAVAIDVGQRRRRLREILVSYHAPIVLPPFARLSHHLFYNSTVAAGTSAARRPVGAPALGAWELGPASRRWTGMVACGSGRWWAGNNVALSSSSSFSSTWSLFSWKQDYLREIKTRTWMHNTSPMWFL